MSKDKGVSMLPPIEVHWPERVGEDEYQRIVESWKAIDNREEGEAYYRRELFPRSCRLIRERAPEEVIELLYVPVGTVAYPPILACLGTPARRTVLLHTEASRPYAEQVKEALAGLESTFLLIQIDEWDPLDIASKLASTHDTLGQPAARQVCCDQTGGTKVMTSAVAGYAAHNGWRQVYVKSEFMRGLNGSYNEVVLPLPNLYRALGGSNRQMAFSLAGMGQFGAASRLLEEALKESLAAGQDERTLYEFKLAAAYRKGQTKKVARSVKSLARRRGVKLSESTLSCLQGEDYRGLLFWMARTLEREGREPASLGLLSLLGFTPGLSELGKELSRLAKEKREEWELDHWQAVDQLLGYPFTKEVAG